MYSRPQNIDNNRMESGRPTSRGRQPYIDYDGIRFYKERGGIGYYLSGRTSDKGPVRLHNYIWKKFNGEIPSDCHIHHKDKNPGNNALENLECINMSLHLSQHGHEDGKADKYRENLNRFARPKSIKWHKSQEGNDWHKEHYGLMKNKLHSSISLNCEVCGKEFTTVNNGHNKFCGNKCKSRLRRASGVDNIMVKCAICGAEFSTNKYNSAKYCSKRCREIGKNNFNKTSGQ